MSFSRVFGLALLLLVVPSLAVAQTVPKSKGAGKGASKKKVRLPLIVFPEETPLQDLLPLPEKSFLASKHLLPQSFAHVPEVALHEQLAANRETSLDHIRQTVGKIVHLNHKGMDRYMAELLPRRPDLRGLPFILGEVARKDATAMMEFAQTLNHVRGVLPGELSNPLTEEELARREKSDALFDGFWQNFGAQIGADVRSRKLDLKGRGVFQAAQVAALMQVCGPEAGPMKRGMAQHLSGIANADSSRALARLAVFAPEEEVRREAIESLKVRRERDYRDILVQGLRYPWPLVAKSAAEAIVALEQKDMLPILADLLDEEDQRLPRAKEESGRTVFQVRELVKINHHRNCLLCHEPQHPDRPTGLLTGAIPIPGERLPSFSEGYRNSTPNLAVRIDVTYLRQDFSTMMKVEEFGFWPQMQRFDFLVRTRTLDAAEAAKYRELTGPAVPGLLNPYQRTALSALRELTGRDAEPTGEAWRRVIR